MRSSQKAVSVVGSSGRGRRQLQTFGSVSSNLTLSALSFGKLKIQSVNFFSPTTRIILTLCFMALLMLASLIPGRPKPGDSAYIRLVAKTPALIQKILHFCLYGVLVILLAWSLESIQSNAYRFVTAYIIAVVFGAVMEWCQTKVPGRFGTFYDVALNAAGAALGLIAAISLF